MSDHAERIRAAHDAYRDSIGTPMETRAYELLRDEVRRREIRTVLEPAFTEREMAWMVSSCPSVEKAKQATRDRKGADDNQLRRRRKAVSP